MSPSTKQVTSVKDRIISVAIELFAEKGFHGTGVAEIGTRAGLGRGALYHHIQSKEELLYEVLRICVDEELLEAAVGTRESSATIPAKIRELSAALLNDVADHRGAWTVYFQDADKLSANYHSDIQARRNRYERIWLDVLMSGVESGELAQFDPVVVKGILGMHNYSYMWLRPGGRLSPTEISSIYASMIVSGLSPS